MIKLKLFVLFVLLFIGCEIPTTRAPDIIFKDRIVYITVSEDMPLEFASTNHDIYSTPNGYLFVLTVPVYNPLETDFYGYPSVIIYGSNDDSTHHLDENSKVYHNDGFFTSELNFYGEPTDTLDYVEANTWEWAFTYADIDLDSLISFNYYYILWNVVPKQQ